MLALLTDEQEMLQQAARQIASTVRLRSPSDLDVVDQDRAWASLADAGLLGLRTRDDGQVPMASGVEVMLVCEALGDALAPVPWLSGIIAAELMARSGANEWMDELVSGAVRYSLLMAPDLSGLARADDLDGAIAFDVEGASFALALSGPDGPDGAARVARIGLTSGFDRLDAADLTRSLTRVVSPGDVSIEHAGTVLDKASLNAWLSLALVATAADLNGVLSSALQVAVDYAKQRVQYGVKIGSFQAVQHMCADALVQVEGAASVTRYAAWAVDALDPPEALLAARVAKAYCSSVAREVTETVMQVFGGIGQTWEHIAHVYSRRALTDRALFGDESCHLQYVADARLGPMPAN